MEEPARSVFEQVRCPVVAVIGPHEATTDEMRAARRIGRALAEGGALVLTGGRGGVMEAACLGAVMAGGTTVGILPGRDESESPPNPYVQIPIYTGLGSARNAIVAGSGGAVIAVGGGYGTLSEIGLALKAGRPVVLFHSWKLEPSRPVEEMDERLRVARNPQEAASLALALAGAHVADDVPPDASTADLPAPDGTEPPSGPAGGTGASTPLESGSDDEHTPETS